MFVALGVNIQLLSHQLYCLSQLHGLHTCQHKESLKHNFPLAKAPNVGAIGVLLQA